MKELLSSPDGADCWPWAPRSSPSPSASVGLVPSRSEPATRRQLTHAHPPSLRPRKVPRPFPPRAGPTRRPERSTIYSGSCLRGSPQETCLRTKGARFHPHVGRATARLPGWGRGHPPRRPAHRSVARHSPDDPLRSSCLSRSFPDGHATAIVSPDPPSQRRDRRLPILLTTTEQRHQHPQQPPRHRPDRPPAATPLFQPSVHLTPGRRPPHQLPRRLHQDPPPPPRAPLGDPQVPGPSPPTPDVPAPAPRRPPPAWSRGTASRRPARPAPPRSSPPPRR